MQVILLEDVKKLGQKGQVIKVAEGYARNFLIPKGLAVEASKGRLKDLEKQNEVKAAQRKKAEDEARALGQQMEGLKLVIPARVGDAGKLFGAINNKDIAEFLQHKHGFNVDKKKIILKTPIKALGEYGITIKLHPAVQVQINVEVVPE
ncbi:50S ribosomal protein L9 [Desulfallas thermosapovorans]|uniref:Large ribosomal subunit protein bL9 n=1 Tax=Desulfallas thermosapovorans DSM 6562 TaxID=1121431 RepID=A0A5S4ZTX9_9FIRM|nr:50S ribosomal protein L9 [Desulfallas thermosapovorans]TYO96437.1 large subunit ribosomal protein L9 [Desulfallas thermosapovorans DSM 6562]